MRKAFILLSIFFFISSCAIQKKANEVNFDRKQWRNNSAYRYEVLNNGKLNQLMKGALKKRFVRWLLGKPYEIRKDNTYSYCLSLTSKQERKKCKCSGDIIVLFFLDKEYPFGNITLEPRGE